MPTDVPHVQHVVIVVQRFDIEPERGRYLVDRFTVEALQDGGFAGIVEAAGKKIRYKEYNNTSRRMKISPFIRTAAVFAFPFLFVSFS